MKHKQVCFVLLHLSVFHILLRSRSLTRENRGKEVLQLRRLQAEHPFPAIVKITTGEDPLSSLDRRYICVARVYTDDRL